jgi:photosystem II stability/assembly factor-like uncharacterized protein
VAFEDRGDDLSFDVSQEMVSIPEGQEAVVDIIPRPRRRQWLGGETRYLFTAKVSTTAGGVQTHSGQAIGRGLIPVWVLPIILILCLLLAGSAVFLPPILFPSATQTPSPTPTATLELGTPILEEWCIYPEGDAPQVFSDCPIQIKAVPGQNLVIRWRVSDAEKVEILPLGDQHLDGQIVYEVLETKTFTLKATNEDKITEKLIEVIVVPPLPADTASPTPTTTQAPVITPTLTPTPDEDREAVKLTGFDMLDMQTGWGEWVDRFGEMSSLLRTADGGLTWQDVTPPDGYPMGSLFYALDGQRAWAAIRQGTTGGSGEAGTVWRTVDGGGSWLASEYVQPHLQGYNALPEFSPQALYFLDEQVGWLVVMIDHTMSKDILAILATNDGGRTWQQVADTFTMGEAPEGLQPGATMPCYVSGIAFSDPQNGYLAGDCMAAGGDYYFTVTSTWDGGYNWLDSFTNPTNLPPELEAAISEGRSTCGAFSVENTPAGILVQHTCRVQETSGEWSSYSYLNLRPTGGTEWVGWPAESASFVSAAEGYSVGPMMEYGTRSLSRTTDGGRTWQNVHSVTWQEVHIDFLLPDQGFALVLEWGNQTYDSAILRTEDGGRSWSLVEGVMK